jgi:hypothetical protein
VYYLTLTEQARAKHYDSLHCLRLRLVDPVVTVTIDQLGKPRARLTLKYLSAKMNQLEVEKLARAITGDDKAEVFCYKTLPPGDWGVLYSSDKEIPHYVSIEIEGGPGKDMRCMCIFLVKEQHVSTVAKTYNLVHKEVRKSIKKDKQAYLDNMAGDGENVAGKNHMRDLYDIIRKLSASVG